MAEDLPSSRSGDASVDAGAAPTIALASASREKADNFLERQSALAELQMENLRLQNDNLQKQDEFELSHLRFRRVSDYARFALEIAGFLVVLLLVCGLGTMVWNASRDRDLVVYAFSVPADVSQSGMTGDVLAGRVLDALGHMQAGTFSQAQGASSFRSNDSNQVRIEIPSTGISLGELDRYLREWLGHETRVAGDLVHTPKGLALTIRYGAEPGTTVEGGNLDTLIGQAAEHLYAASRPLRYADYLGAHGRFAEAEAIIVPLAGRGSPQERALAYVSWGTLYLRKGDPDGEAEKSRIATELDPANAAAWYQVDAGSFAASHRETAVTAEETVLSLMKAGKAADLNPDMASSLLASLETDLAIDKGDSRGAIAQCQSAVGLSSAAGPSDALDCSTQFLVDYEVADHDITEARRLTALIPATDRDGKPDAVPAELQSWLAKAEQDWVTEIALERKVDQLFAGNPTYDWRRRTQIWPELAEAMARSGDTEGARAVIGRTQIDCDRCVIARGTIAAAAHNWAAADHWFALVSARTPSLPYADEAWGEALLSKGDLEDTIAKFKSANQKGPHFADPLEMWGEALIRENRSDLAAVKFAEAAKYAPNWGRLHLKWGDALVSSGDKAGAQKQFAAAGALDLTAAEKAELARVPHV
jgi:tetratricopeptide (TPR) repeat protein